MRYIVEWNDDVVREYQAIHEVAPDPGKVYRAVEAIDEELQDDPAVKGESRPDGLRITFAKPIGVLYHVVEAKRKVFVVGIWRTDRPPTPPSPEDSTDT